MANQDKQTKPQYEKPVVTEQGALGKMTKGGVPGESENIIWGQFEAPARAPVKPRA